MASPGTRQILYADRLESTIGTLLLIHDCDGHVRALDFHPKSGSWLGCPLVGVGWDNRGLRFRRGWVEWAVRAAGRADNVAVLR
jgi:hypothetical protein